jgi:Tol biopolymer transport system component
MGLAQGTLRRSAAWCLAATVVGTGAVADGMLVGARPQPADQSEYRYTPFSFEAGGQFAPVWSPNGNAVAYAARPVPFGPAQIFIRYLTAASPLQLTHGTRSAYPVAWSPDSARVLVTVMREPFGISTLPMAGGDPELVTPVPNVWTGGSIEPGNMTISPDNKVVAAVHPDPTGIESVWITSLLDGRTIRYGPEPFASKDVIDAPMLRFAPDGRHLLLMLNGGHGDEAWLLDYPGGGTAAVHRLFAEANGFGGTPAFSWMPDSRHIVMSYQPAADARIGLWMVDTKTGSRRALTSSTAHTTGPAVSPDGTRLILTENRDQYDVVSVDLATGAAARLIATERSEQGPSWAAAVPVLAYVTDRNGAHEIWRHEADAIDRPVVTAADFPAGTTEWLMGPALSPDGTRVVYARIEAGSKACRLWISGLAGGTAVRLTNDNSLEYPGSWSRDGTWFVYQRQGGGRIDLMKVKATGGPATPVLVKADTKDESVPSWSPGETGFVVGDRLISADGQTEKRLGTRHSQSYVFSADGRSVYGIESNREHNLLFRIDVATNAETVVAELSREFQPDSDVGPEIRFSLAPDGKTFVYSVLRSSQNMWMLTGFAPRTGVR